MKFLLSRKKTMVICILSIFLLSGCGGENKDTQSSNDSSPKSTQSQETADKNDGEVEGDKENEDEEKGKTLKTYESNVRTLLSMAYQYAANNAGLFNNIGNSDVSAEATKLNGKPNGATYVISSTDLTTTLDLEKSNVGTGTYKIVYNFESGEFTEVDTGTLPENIKPSFTKK